MLKTHSNTIYNNNFCIATLSTRTAHCRALRGCRVRVCRSGGDETGAIFGLVSRECQVKLYSWWMRWVRSRARLSQLDPGSVIPTLALPSITSHQHTLYSLHGAQIQIRSGVSYFAHVRIRVGEGMTNHVGFHEYVSCCYALVKKLVNSEKRHGQLL